MTPKWLIEPKDRAVKAGDEVLLECKADGEPKPITKWVDSKGSFN